jgi:hypothetical protein
MNCPALGPPWSKWHSLSEGYCPAVSVRRGWPAAGCDELIFIRATASPDQLELLAGAVLWHPWTAPGAGLVNGFG